MGKVIRLTESDLERIVKKVIKEQTGPGLTSFTPGYSDYRFNTKEINPVGLAQRALIKKGYSVGPKGADGIMGPNTKNAILKYQKDNNTPSQRFRSVKVLLISKRVAPAR